MKWTINEAVKLVREMEDVVHSLGWHTALTGSVLQEGRSDNDLDIIFYPYKTALCQTSPVRVLSELRSYLNITAVSLRTQKHGDDTKMVYRTLTDDDRRIDCFFLR